MLGRKTAALAALTAGALGAAAPAAQADTTTVTDCGELQDALSPGPGDPVYDTVILDGKVCADDYAIHRDVTFKGINDAGFVGTNSAGRSLTIDNVYDVTVDGLSFTGGEKGGGVQYVPPPRVIGDSGVGKRVAAEPDPGDLTVTNTTFTGIENTGDGDSYMNEGYGGGLYAEVDGTLTVRDDTEFKDNSADASGGGAFVDLSVPDEAEPAPRAAGGGSAANITGTTFETNTAGTDGDVDSVRGGGLAIEGELPQIVKRSAARAGTAADVALAENTFTGNGVEHAFPGQGEIPASRTREGGGAGFVDVTVTSDRERYTGNEVGDGTDFGTSGGGAVSLGSDDKRASFSATNGAFTANTTGSGGNGGAFLLHSADLELIHSTVSGNTAAVGSGVGTTKYYEERGSSTVAIDRSIVWGNTELPRASRASAQEGVDEVSGVEPEATRSDYCVFLPDLERAPDEAGNICEDPKLADVPNGDVHQTAASPTIDAVGPAPAGRAAGAVVAVDWERKVGDARPQGNAADMGADEVPVKAVTPDPTPTPRPTTPAVSPPQGGVLPQVQSSVPCTSKRFFRITLRKKQGRVYKSAKISVNGTKVKVTLRKGRPTTRLDLRKFGYQTIRIKITAKVKGGKTLKGTRTYHPCRPSLDDGKPPKL